MNDIQRDFDQRQRELQKKYRQLSKGYVTRINPDGIIEHHPYSKSRGLSWPIRALCVLIIAVFLVKAGLLNSIGQDAYTAQLDLLNQGDIAQRFAGWVMQIDLVTASLADWYQAIFA